MQILLLWGIIRLNKQHSICIILFINIFGVTASLIKTTGHRHMFENLAKNSEEQVHSAAKVSKCIHFALKSATNYK